MEKIKILILMLIILSLESCFSQRITVKNLDNNSDMNYIFSRIIPTSILNKSLYNDALFVTTYKLSDSKATPKEYMEEFFSSYIISVIPDGDYYSYSKLYKIEGILYPKIIEIKETNFPNFKIKIEYGPADKRKIETFEFEGIQ